MSTRILRAEVSSLTKIGGGGFVIVSADSARKNWKDRPWFTRVSWNPARTRWEVRVYPGFVNGVDPTCQGYLQDDPKDSRGNIRDVELFDLPWIPVPGFRAIDGSSEAIPAFFAQRGVRKDKAPVIQGEKVVTDGTPEDPSLPARRYLKAADIWVSVARATYQMQTTVTGNLFTGQLVDYTVGYDTRNLDRVGARARLLVGIAMPPTQSPNLMDRLNGIYQDDGEDRQIISTVYLLSPPEQPDAEIYRWTPYVRHWCGWNLLYAAKNDPPTNRPTPQGDPFLKFFVGRYTIVPQATQGALDAETQRILAALFNSTSNEGRFWTI